jgi:hypothetical protein
MEATNRRANVTRTGQAQRANAVEPANGRVGTRTPQVPEIAPEARRRLAECCAFFKAQKYRDAEPGKIRASDVTNAQAEIDTAIENCGKQSRSA